MKFHFKAQKKSGEIYEDVREAPDRFALYNDLKKDGDTVLFVVQENKMNLSKFSMPGIFFSRIGMHEKIIFANNLGNMTAAGLSVSRSLSIMAQQTKNKKVVKIITGLGNDISRGVSISESMKNFPEFFTPLFVHMTKAGEESGNLPESLKLVASQLEKTYNLEKQIRGAMIYPAVIFLVMIAIAVLMLVYIIPTLSSIFHDINGSLPLTTRLIIDLSDLLQQHYFIVSGIVAVFVAALVVFWRSRPGKRFFNWFVLHFPIVAPLAKETNSARTARTMSSLLSAGVDIVLASKITSDILQNSYYKKVMKIVEEKVQKGEQISEIFAKYEDLYPPFVAEMISVGEETGKLPEMLMDTAKYYEDDVDQKTKDMTAVIEPILIVIIGVAVGFFAVAIIAPIYSLVSTI